MMPSGVLPVVIEQHVDELTTLWAARTGLRAAGFIGLRQLAQFDDRIAAHEDGCVLAGSDAVDVLTSRLDLISAGRVFAAAVVALDLHDGRTISQCLALADANPDARRGMTSALGWVSSSQLKGVVKDLLKAPSAIQRSIGLAACRLHGVDPGLGLPAALKDPNPDVRAAGVRAAGVLGLAPAYSLSSRANGEAPCQFWSAWTDVLLGDRREALSVLMAAALRDGVHRRRAFHLVCQAATTAAGHDFLRSLADE